MTTKPYSSDERRLLSLFRDMDWPQQSALLHKLTRARYAEWFASAFVADRDMDELWRYHAELEEQLRLVCPTHHFGELHRFFQGLYFTSLFSTAWGETASVILGSGAQDGQRADELLSAVFECCSGEWRRPVTFTRRHALALIEEWREAVLQQVFSCAKVQDCDSSVPDVG